MARVLAERYAPPAVLVDGDGLIMGRFGALDEYLSPSRKDEPARFAELLKPDLKPFAESAVLEACGTGVEATALCTGQGPTPDVLVRVSPVTEAALLVCFEQESGTGQSNGDRSPSRGTPRRHKDDLGRLVTERTRTLDAALAEARRQAAEAGEGKRFLGALMEHVPVGIVIADTDGSVRYISRHAEDICGRMTHISDVGRRGSFSGWHLYAPDGSTRISWTDLPLAQAMRLGRAVKGEEWRFGPDPERLKPILSDAAPIFDEQGQVTGGIAVLRDISDWRGMEQARLDREQLYKALVEHTPDPIARFGGDGRCLYVNPALVAATGVSNEFMVGRRIGELEIGQTAAGEFEEVLDHVIATGEEAVLEMALVLAGHRRRLHMRFAPERAREGQVVSVLAVGRDITELHEARVALQQAKEAAEAANRAKSEFLANMSHEIRTPISGILGLTDVMLMKGGDPPIMERLRLIRQSGRSLMFLINDILDLSRIEARGVELAPADFALEPMLAAVTALFEHQVEAKGLHLELRMAPGLPARVRGDEHRLAQVLRNLLSNAVKFTEQGGVRLMVDLAGWREDSALITFGVEDTGVGIPAERLDELFNNFVQLDSSYAKRHGGSGLGLAISRQLVELMGGQLRVESTHHVGSLFHFTIPLQGAASRPEDLAQSEQAPSPTEGGLRILVAEDNEINQVVLESELSERGHRPLVVSDGLQVLEALEREHFDLVLMDVQMPEMDGLEATRRIRESGLPWAAIPIVALTAYAMKGDRERFLEAGMNDYLSKPIDFEQLYAVLERLREGSGI